MEKSKLIETKTNLTTQSEKITKEVQELSKQIQEKQSSLLMIQGALELNEFYIKELEKAEEVKIETSDIIETIKE